MLHDISDLRRADRVRRDFVANVSHELRTPLTAIRGYVEALMDEPTSSDQSRQFLEIIARHTDRMERLVKDLLRLARLDAGQETTDLVECDLYALLQGVVNELAVALSARETAVSLDVAADMRSLVSDPAKLHDVVRNLLENAVNYSPEGAPVRIEAFRDGGDAVLRVIDAGPGIPPQRSRPRVRALLSRGEVARARAGRHGHRPGDREAPGRPAQRHGDGAERAGERRRVHRAAAARLDGRRAGGDRRGSPGNAIDGPDSIEVLARVAAQIGEPDRAIAALLKLLSVPGVGPLASNMPLTSALLRLDPMFDPLRNDPRFQKIVEEAKEPVATSVPAKSIAVLPFGPQPRSG